MINKVETFEASAAIQLNANGNSTLLLPSQAYYRTSRIEKERSGHSDADSIVLPLFKQLLDGIKRRTMCIVSKAE